jgi:hypothetical protein
MAKHHIAIFYEYHEPDSKDTKESRQFLRGIKELSANELQDLRHYIRKITAYTQNRHLFVALSLNVEDFKNTCNQYLADYHETQAMKWDMAEQMSVNLGRLFLNILNLFRCFLDHSESTLKRRFGTNSETVEEWKQAISKCYDESFAYRLMYHLRNYGQHVGVPPLKLEISSEADEPLIGTETAITSDFHIEIETQPLLNDKHIFKKLANDITPKGPVIDLMPILEEWFVQMRDLVKTRQKIEIPFVWDAAKEIVSLRNKISAPDHAAICILTIPNNHKDDELSPKMEWFPEREAQSILRQSQS